MSDKEKIEEISGRWKKWNSNASQRNSRNEEIEKLYRASSSLSSGSNLILSKGKSKSRDSRGSEMFRDIEVSTAKTYEIIHSDPVKFFATEIHDLPDVSKQAQISDRISYDLRNDFFPSKSVSLIRSSYLYGETYGAVGKDPEKDKATIRLIGWRDIAIDPLAQGLDRSRRIIERHYIDEAELAARKDAGVYSSEAVSKLLAKIGPQKKDAESSVNVPVENKESNSSVSDAGFSGDPSEKGIEILDEWKYLKGKWVVSTVGQGYALLRDDSKNPFAHGSHPFFGGPLINLSGRNEGIGTGETSMSSQNTMNRLMTRALAILEHSLLNLWIYDKNAIDPDDLIKKIDGLIPAKDIEKIKHLAGDLSPVEYAIRMIQILQESQRQSSATPDLRQGPTQEPTLGQTVISRDESASRHMIYAQQLASGGIYERILWLFWETTKQFDTKPIQFQGSDPKRTVDILPSAIESKVRFSIDITSPRRDPQSRVLYLKEMLLLAVQPEMKDKDGKPLFNAFEIASRYAQASGEPDPEGLVNTPPAALPQSPTAASPQSTVDTAISEALKQSQAAPQAVIGPSGNGVPIV